jgi:pyridinium-3,5-bisthiocarboxylic acid mononucleotide nickel chelatase
VSRVLYFDCFSGISGDMTLGALLDAGLPLDDLRAALGSLMVGGYHVHAKKVLRAGVSATKFSVHEHKHEAPGTVAPGTGAPGTLAPGTLAPGTVAPGTQHSSTQHPSTQHDHDHAHDGPHAHEHEHEHEHPHRSLPEIFGLIDRSALGASGRERAKAMFQTLAEAEAAIHQMPVEQVHLHEVGALDSIVDIVGTVFGLEWAGADRIVCSPLNVGGGMVRSAHGLFPVPAPATVRLLGSAPIYSGPVQKELVTPTGALIATSYATAFGPVPAMTIERVGYGAGDRDDPSTPNVLRVLIGESTERAEAERVIVIECEIDDMNPQIFGVAMDRLYAAGALEVFYVPVQMKKNRPGTLLTIVCRPEQRAALADIVFSETTTIGLRYSEVDRECLQREIVAVETPIGSVRFKIARRGGAVVNAAPEFDDCVALAARSRLPVKEVQALAARAYADSRSVRLEPDRAGHS